MAFTFGSIFATGVPLSYANVKLALCGYGLYSELPAPAAYVSVNSPGNAGMIARATDKNMLYQSSGSAWVPIGVCPPSATPTLDDVLKWDGTKWAAITYGGIPSGGVIIWTGTIANIPSGWVICDGNNGTVNLLSRMVVGVATAGTNPGTTGNLSHTHTYNDNGGSMANTGAGLASNLWYAVAYIMKT